MGAIAAILHRDGKPVALRDLQTMLGALRDYGPDCADLRCHGPAGVAWCGHIGLTPQDALERQPLRLTSGALLVFAGRLDHREELGCALGLNAGETRQVADSALVARAWEKWDERAVEHLFGEYSLLLVDARRRRLFGARGPLRSPPLHYHQTRERIAVASMPRGLFALGDVPRDLDEQRLADALVLNFEDKQASYFASLRSVPLGHSLAAREGDLAIRCFYDLRDTPSLRLGRDEDYVEAGRELLAAAVGSAMRSVRTPALTLSSGLDSTTVAVAALARLAGSQGAGAQRLLGLVAVPEPGWDGPLSEPGTAGDESGPVRAFAARYPQLDVRYATSAGLPIDHKLDPLIAAAEMPLRAIGSSHWSIELDRIALEEGRRVCLSGASGNATLSLAGGTAMLARLFREGHWLRFLREVRRRSAVAGDRRWLGFAGVRAPILATLPRALFRLYDRLRPDEGWRQFSPINPDFAVEMRVEERMRDMGWDDSRQPLRNRRELMAMMLDRGGRHESGAALMAFHAVTGVEARDPLGDRKLAEFCYAIPDDQYYRDGVDRRLIRRMMQGALPEEILNAPRGRQSADWHVRLRRDAERHDAELERLSRNPLVARVLNIPRLRFALKALAARTASHGSGQSDILLLRYGLGRALGAARFIEQGQDRLG